MPAAAVQAGATVAGGLLGGKGAASAAKANARAQELNRQEARKYYDEAAGRYQPDIARGDMYSETIQALLGLGGGDQQVANKAFQNFQDSSGYQYQLNQGLGAVNSNAYATGMGNSGATLKALQDRGNQLANMSITGYLGQLTGQQGVGQNAKGALTNMATNTVTNLTNANNSQAASTGNSALAQGNIGMNVLNQLGQIGSNQLGQSSYKPSPTTSVTGG